MKKRDFKGIFKEVQKMNYHSMDKKQKRVSKNDTGKIKLPIYWMEETICLSPSFGNKSSWRWHVLPSSSSSTSHVLGVRGRDVMSKGIEINWRNINAVKTNLPRVRALRKKTFIAHCCDDCRVLQEKSCTNLKLQHPAQLGNKWGLKIHNIKQPIT